MEKNKEWLFCIFSLSENQKELGKTVKQMI